MSNRLVIDGAGFRAGLYAGLAGRDLTVLSISAHEVRAALPALPSGSYRLTLRHRFDTAHFIVTIGAAGPAGPQGPAGAATFAGIPGLKVLSHGTLVGTLALDSNGVMFRYYPIFFTGGGCTGDAYAYVDSNPAPLVPVVQRMTASDTTWGRDQYVGPLQTIDISQFTAPFSIQ